MCSLTTSQHHSLPPCIFFFNDTATTEIYTLSLHDALPIYLQARFGNLARERQCGARTRRHHGRTFRTVADSAAVFGRSEEHTSELQSRRDLVCRLLLEKKKKTTTDITAATNH